MPNNDTIAALKAAINTELRNTGEAEWMAGRGRIGDRITDRILPLITQLEQAEAQKQEGHRLPNVMEMGETGISAPHIPDSGEKLESGAPVAPNPSVTSMTELDAAAIDFARECLGWPEVEAFVVDYRKQIVRNLAAAGDCMTVFYASDLNTVMDRVREWCDGRCGWSLASADETQRVQATIYTDCGQFEATHDNDPRIALMAACAAAARMMKAGGPTSEPPAANPG